MARALRTATRAVTRRATLAWLFGGGFLAGCAPLETLDRLTPVGSYRLAKDQPYGAGPRRRLDVYSPVDAPGPRPVIVFFYGGSWRKGDKDGYRFIGEYLTRHGVVAMIADYRLYPEVTFPGFVEDGAAAIAWAKANAARFGGDPNRVFAMGHSAGAHTAALLALDPRYLAREGLTPSALAGVIGISGPYDLAPERVRWLRPTFATAASPDDVRPLAFARAGAPPMLLLNGETDALVPPASAEELAARLRAAGGPVELRVYPKLGHLDILLGLSTTLAGDSTVGSDVLAFVERG